MLTATSQFISLHVAFDDLREQKRRASRHDGTWQDSMRGRNVVEQLNRLVDKLDAMFATGQRQLSTVDYRKMVGRAKSAAAITTKLRMLRYRVHSLKQQLAKP